MSEHEKYMQRCLDLAVLGAGTVSPNPMVGAVVVHTGRIIGEGFTSPFGGNHAEVNAIQDVLTSYGEENGKSLLKESTIYVSLEPCAHYGKTPPCADMLINYQIPRIVIGCQDPFVKVNGLGVAKLLEAGLDVIMPVLEQKCQFINRRFFTKVSKYRPYVILKWAETANGYFAPIDKTQRWISNSASKQLVHKWRAEEDAILVGTRTALIDNPHLDTRLWYGKSPKRVLIDKNLSVPSEANVFKSDNTDLIIFNAIKTDWRAHLKYIELENFDLYLPQNILYQLYLMDVQSIIIEGGAKTLQQFIDAGLWDEARVFVGTDSWNEGVLAPQLTIPASETIKVSSNLLNYYYAEK